jgi:sodium transport system ATP-binding protein
MQEIGALCDDLVIIGKGRVVLQGSPDEVRAATGCDDLEEAFVRLSQAEHAA